MMGLFANEPAFLSERRAAAREKALTLPLPDRALHRFRFTDPAALVPGGAFTAALLDAVVPADVTVDLPESARAAGVRVRTLAEAAAELPDLVAEHLGRVAGTDDPFLAASLARPVAVVVVSIPAGAVVADPITVRATSSAPADVLAAARVLVHAGRGCQATLVEDVSADTGFLHVVSEGVLEDGARLVHARTEAVAAEAAGFARAAWAVGRDAHLTHVHVLVPGGLLKSEAAPTLAGAGARSEGLAAAIPGARGKADFRVREDHAVPDASSDVKYRAVATGKGRAIFTGLLRIREGAARSEAYEEARALLLSKNAVAEVIPELEILNHDVRCSHGAAVGPVDEDARFYLMTRGLSPKEAEAMLVEGFVEPVVGRLPGDLGERARETLRRALDVA